MSATTQAAAAAAAGTVKPLRREEIGSGRWLRLERVHFEDAAGNGRSWELVRRTTTGASGVDGADVVAVTSGPAPRDPPTIVLVLVVRPPAGRACLELPAGLLDEGEDFEAAGLRELREETGYVGTPSGRGRGLAPAAALLTDPWKSNETVQMVFADVDLADPRNAAPKQKLEEDEEIEVVRLPLRGLLEAVQRLVEERGVAVHAQVYTLALGLEMARRFL